MNLAELHQKVANLNSNYGGIMGETFSQCWEVLVNDASWRSDDSTSFRQLGQDYANSVAQLVTYCLLAMRLNIGATRQKFLTGENF